MPGADPEGGGGSGGDIFNVPWICSGTLRIAPRALQFLHFPNPNTPYRDVLVCHNVTIENVSL